MCHYIVNCLILHRARYFVGNDAQRGRESLTNMSELTQVVVSSICLENPSVIRATRLTAVNYTPGRPGPRFIVVLRINSIV